MVRKVLLVILTAFVVLSCGTLDELQRQLENTGFGDYNPLGTNTPLNNQTAISPPSGTATLTSTATPIYLTINGVWHCRAEPNVLSDTLAFLHDGEIVQLVEAFDNWNKVMAGNVECFVNKEAFK